MKKKNKKKKITAALATVMALVLLLGGTFAWQSISQVALNEKSATINPGGRLHDDFDGSNKDIYVENFADEQIFARVRLDEYFEVITNKGTPVESTKKITSTATKGDTSTYVTHKFGEENATDGYWEWSTGGSTMYMPTFNKNKDSLKADINGTYAENYADYVDYSVTTEKTANAVYDNDDNDVDDENVVQNEETHNSKSTLGATLVSMEQWIADGSNKGNYWVYDTDGWVYWANAIDPDTSTGLLLDSIALKNSMDDSYYYAINAVAQFITADDIGYADNTGFYEDASQKPSDNALDLLDIIGVNTNNIIPAGDTIYAAFTTRESDEFYDLTYFTSAESLSKKGTARALGVSEDKVAAYYEMPTDSEEISEDYEELIVETKTVQFKNEVKPTDMSYWFFCLGSELDEISVVDWTNLDTSNVTNMSSMFKQCNIESLTFGDEWDTSNVTDMSNMFRGCYALTSLTFGDEWDTSNVTKMVNMFNKCSSLTSLTLGDGWDTSKVTEMYGMFEQCVALENLILGDKWDTSNVTNMNYMFQDCTNLTLDCSGWSVDKVTSHRDFASADSITQPNWVN